MPKRKQYNKGNSIKLEKSAPLKRTIQKCTYMSQDTERSTRNNNILKNTLDTFKKYSKGNTQESGSNRRIYNTRSSTKFVKTPQSNYTKTSQGIRQSTRNKKDIQSNELVAKCENILEKYGKPIQNKEKTQENLLQRKAYNTRSTNKLVKNNQDTTQSIKNLRDIPSKESGVKSENTSKSIKNKENTETKVSNRKRYNTKYSIKLVKTPQLMQSELKNTNISQSIRQSSINKNDIRSNKLGTKCNNTFKKYGMYVPSYEEIISERKNCDNYIEFIENLINSVSPLPVREKFTLVNDDSNILIRDCTELSLEELKIIFQNNIKYLDAIKEEKTPCKRHILFKNGARTDEFTLNSGTILFTNVQKQTLVSLLCETYGSTDLLTDYYFKVLLPELCLKIYIDKYNTTYEEALRYLDNYPVVIKV